MCTLTWLIKDNGYEVFFNRDEQRSRPEAIAPAYNQDTDSIMPIDPQGKGTWIAVNSAGVTLCLLNNYQCEANINKTNNKSRGLLIPYLIKQKHHEQIVQDLMAIELNQYMPFCLCIFPHDLKKDNEAIYIYQWDGEKLTTKQSIQPVISSAVSLPEVEKIRKALFTEMLDQRASSEKHIAYHSSHAPEKGKYSVCMHREDACTQSLSHICVNRQVEFNYHNLSPCMNLEWSNTVIQDRSKNNDAK